MFLSKFESRVARAFRVDPSNEPTPALTHLLWFSDGLLLFFLIPWIASTRLQLDNDLYYAIFIWCALTFLYRYARCVNVDVVSLFRRRWRTSLFLGVLVTIYLVVTVWRATPTEGPDGLLLIFEIAWRGVAYGMVSALVLTTFPLAVAHGLLPGDATSLRRRFELAGLALLLIAVLSTTHHRGFEQYDDDLITPQLVTGVVSVPAVLTLNPLGSLVAQISLNVAVTVQAFETDLFAPPEVEFIPNYEPPGIFGPR